jgi:hypothetical protein
MNGVDNVDGVDDVSRAMEHIPADVRLGSNDKRLLSAVDVVPPRVGIDWPVGRWRTASTAIGLISLAFNLYSWRARALH